MEGKPLAKRLGAAIRVQRLAVGMTQAQLAEAIQVEKETVSRFETGALTPTLGRLEHIADTLQIPIGGLFRAPSDKSQDQAEDIAQMMSGLPKKERALVIQIVRDLTTLLRKR